MDQVAQIRKNDGSTKFTVPTKPRLSPEGLFRLSGFGTGGVRGYRPSDPEFARNLRQNVLCSGSPEQDNTTLSFVWLGQGTVKFAEVPRKLKSLNLRPATLRECLALRIQAGMMQTRQRLNEVYKKYFVDKSTTLYVLGSRDLITVKQDKLFFGPPLTEVHNRNSRLLTHKYYWILAAEL